MSTERFDIIVVGAGHAGIEAALAAQRLGLKVLLATNNFKRMGYIMHSRYAFRERNVRYKFALFEDV